MLVAIEGIDGAGKRTQTTLLQQHAQAQGLRTAVFSFPRYGTNPFSQTVSQYLNGDFGDVGDVAPHFAALLYAGDRFVARQDLLTACATHDLVLCDRYVASNLAYQAAKLPHPARAAFVSWLRNIEYTIYHLPPADLTLLLDMPVAMTHGLILRKASRDYTPLQADIHERNSQYLQVCRNLYLQLAAAQKEGAWYTLACTDTQGNLRDPIDISRDLWHYIAAHIPMQ